MNFPIVCMQLMRTEGRRGRIWPCRWAVIGCAFAWALQSASAATVWIDTDPSIGSPFREVDDAFALILAFHSPELEIAGISTTYGNTSLKAATRITQDLTVRFGRRSRGAKNIAIHSGAHSPRDLGRATPATEGLRHALQKEELTYLALGPLTNLATFQTLHPALARRIKQVLVVGGQSPNEPLAFGPNGFLRVHDANVFKDPAAMAALLRSDLPLTLTPVATSSRLLLNAADLKSLRRSEAGIFLHRHTRVWIWFWRNIVRMSGGPLFDALAVLAVARPELVRTERRYATMNEARDLIVREERTRGARAVRYCAGLDPAARAFVRERLARP